MIFKDLQEMIPTHKMDIALKYEDNFRAMMDFSGLTSSWTMGFHFSLGKENVEDVRKMLKDLAPICVWMGTQEGVERFNGAGFGDFKSTCFPFFGDGGYMVVLKVPIR